ncbi:MAG: hypothetical protein ACYDHE_17055 [Candidatus Acidiferrales bacterium]
MAAASALNIGGGVGTVLPATAKRWSMIWSAIFSMPAYPGAEGMLLTSDNDPFYCTINPSGTLNLRVGTGFPIVATSTAMLPLNPFIQLEVWEGYKDSAGNALATKQWVVRTLTLFPLTYTTFINVNVNPGQNLGIGGFNGTIGDVSTYPSPAMKVCNVWGGWEDADNPMGVHRIDLMRPSVIKGVGHLNQWPGNCANVNEALPDDATTQDTVSVINATLSQLYKLNDPFYIAAADLLTDSVIIGVDLLRPPLGKNVTNALEPLASNGVTDAPYTSVVTTNIWINSLRMVRAVDLNGGVAVPWTLPQLQGLQLGALATTNDTAAELFHMSTVAALTGYQKAGEAGTALPAPIVPPVTLPFRMAVDRTTPRLYKPGSPLNPLGPIILT